MKVGQWVINQGLPSDHYNDEAPPDFGDDFWCFFPFKSIAKAADDFELIDNSDYVAAVSIINIKMAQSGFQHLDFDYHYNHSLSLDATTSMESKNCLIISELAVVLICGAIGYHSTIMKAPI